MDIVSRVSRGCLKLVSGHYSGHSLKCIDNRHERLSPGRRDNIVTTRLAVVMGQPKIKLCSINYYYYYYGGSNF